VTGCPCHDPRVFSHRDPRCPDVDTPPARLRAAPSPDQYGMQLRFEPLPVTEHRGRAARLLMLGRSGRG
jgi:hypothetical protein